MKTSNYALYRDEVINTSIEVYFSSKYYQINPKIKSTDAITVSHIYFFSEEICQSLIKKKIEKKLNNILELIDNDDDDGDSFFNRTIMELERFKLKYIKEYARFLDDAFGEIIMKRCDVIKDLINYNYKESNNTKRR